MVTSTPRIAIIGAGPASLTLARLLHLSSITSSIYELDASPVSRKQGGTLDLHAMTGLLAMKKMALWSDFLHHARWDGEALRVANKHYELYVDKPRGKGEHDGPGAKPEIDRSRLRQILLASLPKETINWGRKLCEVQLTVDGKSTLLFANGSEAGPFDLVVGGDGAWSRVRSLVTDVKPHHTGIAGWSAQIETQDIFPELESMINHGSLIAADDKRWIGAQQLGDGQLRMHVWGRHTQDWEQEIGFDVRDSNSFKSYCQEVYKDWHPMLQKIPQVINADLMPWDCYMLPVGHHWEHRQGVTLIGDAAHLMTPFSGEGVNLAMTDAMEVADLIIGAKDGGFLVRVLNDNIKVYEEDMFVRAAKVAKRTEVNMKSIFFEEDGVQKLMAKMKALPETNDATPGIDRAAGADSAEQEMVDEVTSH